MDARGLEGRLHFWGLGGFGLFPPVSGDFRLLASAYGGHTHGLCMFRQIKMPGEHAQRK